MPLIAPLVAAGVSMGVAVGVTACKVLFAMLNPSAKVPWLVRKPMAAASALIAALGGTLAGLSTTYLPVYVVLPALLRSGVSQPAAIAAMLLLLLVPPMILPPCKPAEVRADLLLYFIVLWHHGYLLAWPAFFNSGLANGSLHPESYLGVVVASTLSLGMHTRSMLYDFVLPTRSRSSGERVSRPHQQRHAAVAAPRRQSGSSSGGSRRDVSAAATPTATATPAAGHPQQLASPTAAAAATAAGAPSPPKKAPAENAAKTRVE